MDIFDRYPQKFYLLSSKQRSLLDFSSADHSFAHAVDEAFDSIKAVSGGNIHAVYCFSLHVLEVMEELSEKYKDQYKCVQQLPGFFKCLEEGDYFIRQRTNVSLMDLKRSILETEARTLGLDVRKTDNAFVLKWGRLYLSYDTFSYGYLTDKVFVGEPDKNIRVCRFCKGTGAARYRNTSHALQEALGNHLLFAYEECDECNSLFSNSVEKPLFKFLETNRTLSQVRGKGNSNHNQEGFNFHIHPDVTTNEPVVYVKQERIVNDSLNGRPTGKILLYNNGYITYQGVYKALVKFAVDMIPSEFKDHFIRTGEWVHGDFESNGLPPFCYGEHTLFFEQPVLDLFFRNEKSPTCSPYCTVVLYVFNSVFIYNLPYNDVDAELYMAANEIAENMKRFKDLQYLLVHDWVEYDSNDTTETCAIYKVSAIGRPGKYRVEYRPSSDPIFEIKRKEQ